MSSDKYLNIFSRQMEAIVYILGSRAIRDFSSLPISGSPKFLNGMCSIHGHYIYSFANRSTAAAFAHKCNKID